MLVNPEKFKQSITTASAAVISTLFLVVPVNLQAQVLEEIVVTAQRREQSLQDVPISIDLYSGTQIQKEGFNNLEELSSFAPGIFVQEGGDQGSDMFIRGFGTVGRNWANDSATPMFLDNVNLGQASMGALAFMDVQRVEILKGPQPIHFGMNATGGAVNIVSARPTDVWDGYVNVEIGQSGEWTLFRRDGEKELEGAISGPVTDTLNFRAAGIYATSDGYLRDGVTLQPMAYRNTLGGRLSLEWSPTDRLTVLGKAEVLQQDWSSGSRVCRRDFADLPNRFRRTPTTPTFADVETDTTALWLDYVDGGSGMATPTAELPDCEEKYNYISQTEILEAPAIYVRSRDTTTGLMDTRLAADRFFKTKTGGDYTANPGTYGLNPATGLPYTGTKGDGTGTTRYGLMGGQSANPMNFLLDLSYDITENITAQWTNAYMHHFSKNLEGARGNPLAESLRHRIENYDQYSTELRISSYGGGTFEWMVGGFLQKEDLYFNTIDPRAEIRFNNRMNDNNQDTLNQSYFGNLTFNFMENKVSLDAGVRYSKVTKEPILRSYSSSWIFDVTPCTGRSTGPVANRAHPDVWKGDTSDWGGLPVQNVTPADCIKGLEPLAQRIDAEDAMFLLDTMPGRNVNLNNLWFVPASAERHTPATWRSPHTIGVGFTPWSTELRNVTEQWSDIKTSWDNVDPQIVLRYRPTDDLSLYAKYASAFKAGGFDLGFGGSQPTTFDELSFDPEYGTTFEIGASGNYWEGRGRYQAVLFRVDFEDLIATTIANPLVDNQSTIIVNIGEQRAEGFELDTQLAVTDQLTTSVNFAYLNSRLTHFPNALCTEHEIFTIADSGCALVGSPTPVPLIDRSGQTSAFSPKWAVAGSIDYWMPYRDYKVDFGATGRISASYYTDFRGFSQATIQDSDPDLNLHLGIGEMNDKWRVGLSFRGLLEPREVFRPEYTSNYTELSAENLRSNQVKSVALTFQYNFFD